MALDPATKIRLSIIHYQAADAHRAPKAQASLAANIDAFFDAHLDITPTTAPATLFANKIDVATMGDGLQTIFRARYTQIGTRIPVRDAPRLDDRAEVMTVVRTESKEEPALPSGHDRAPAIAGSGVLPLPAFPPISTGLSSSSTATPDMARGPATAPVHITQQESAWYWTLWSNVPSWEAIFGAKA